MCGAESQIDNIRVLYKEAQQDRRQLSQTIVRSMGCTIAVNAGIWAFFLKGYVDTLGLEGRGSYDMDSDSACGTGQNSDMGQL